MKPDWKDAPEWAQWLAQDPDGDWYWYEKKPSFRSHEWGAEDGKACYAGNGTPELEPEPRP